MIGLKLIGKQVMGNFWMGWLSLDLGPSLEEMWGKFRVCDWVVGVNLG